MTTMKAVRLHEFGGPDVLRYEDAPRPEAGPGEVLIRVRAVGVNPLDWKTREGQMEAMMPHTLPLILGTDAAGTVEAGGLGVTEFKPGDEVFASVGMVRDGSYAEYVLADAKAMALKPKSADFETAASTPGAALTAWQALFDIARLSAGQTVLIHGAGGAVGSAAVQFAKNVGATVIATASSADKGYVQGLGADTVVDYKAERFEDAARDVDVVLDTVGGETQARSFATMKKGGVLVATVAPPDMDAAAKAGVTAKMIQLSQNGAQLREIGQLMDAGKFQVRVGLVLPLSEARQAQERGQAGQARGKIVLQVQSS